MYATLITEKKGFLKLPVLEKASKHYVLSYNNRYVIQVLFFTLIIILNRIVSRLAQQSFCFWQGNIIRTWSTKFGLDKGSTSKTVFSFIAQKQLKSTSRNVCRFSEQSFLFLARKYNTNMERKTFFFFNCRSRTTRENVFLRAKRMPSI